MGVNAELVQLMGAQLEVLLPELAIPWKCGHFPLADSCSFASLSDYRTPVHFVSLAFAGVQVR
ncbi:MAG: hypothetical protein ACRDND_20905 [Streptosporangiaceae bacterium]